MPMGRGRWLRYVAKEWPVALLVAALVAILHHKFVWLDAIDGNAFAVISNLGFADVADREDPLNAKREAIALIAEIDDDVHESRHLGRSPLNRCELYKDLRQIYLVKPDLVVVDIDLSPARWIAMTDPRPIKSRPDDDEFNGVGTPPAEAEAEDRDGLVCQQRLYREIRNPGGGPAIPTVLVTPFALSPEDIAMLDEGAKQEESEWSSTYRDFDPIKKLKYRWMRWMEKESGVRFGYGELPSNYGIIIKQYADPRSLAAVACAMATTLPKRDGLCTEVKEAADKRAEEFGARTTERKLIDARQYKAGMRLVSLKHPPGKLPALNDAMKQVSGGTHIPYRAVFFGGAYGDGDTHLTPIGDLFGVEIHAAAYLSLLDVVPPVVIVLKNLVMFVVDIAIALGFGIVISWFWIRFYKLHRSPEANRKQRAPLQMVWLLLSVIVLTTLVSWVSLWLLALTGLWFSPMPIAIGMLFESFVTGGVAEAMREEAPVGEGPMQGGVTFCEFVRGNWSDLRREGEWSGIVLFVAGRMIWLISLGTALWVLIRHH